MALSVSTKKKVLPLLNSGMIMFTLSMYFLAIDVTSLNITSFGWPFENWFNGLNISTLLTLEERGNNMVCVCNCNNYKAPCNYEMLKQNRRNQIKSNHSTTSPIIGKLVHFNLFNLTYFESLFKKKFKTTTTSTTQSTSTSTVTTTISTSTTTASTTTSTTEEARTFSNVTNSACLCECQSSRNSCYWPNQHPDDSYSSGSYFPFFGNRKLPIIRPNFKLLKKDKATSRQD